MLKSRSDDDDDPKPKFCGEMYMENKLLDLCVNVCYKFLDTQ